MTNSPEQAPESRPTKERRVGTFTFGAVLVICGVLMLVSMFFPRLDLTLVLKLSPLILVSLGVEVLLASRREVSVTARAYSCRFSSESPGCRSSVP